MGCGIVQQGAKLLPPNVASVRQSYVKLTSSHLFPYIIKVIWAQRIRSRTISSFIFLFLLHLSPARGLLLGLSLMEFLFKEIS